MTEIDLTGANPTTHPELTTWEWPVAAYLFLGGLVGGLMILAAVLRLRKRPGFEHAIRFADLWAFPLLVVGLAMLFLDLSYKLHFWRFFTTFKVSSAMSWGSWILLLASVTLILRASLHLPALPWFGTARIPKFVRRSFTAVAGRVSTRTRLLDAVSIALGTALAFYTGILLSTIPARPLWDSVALAPLFLISGFAAAGAFVCLSLPPSEHRRLTPLAMALCGGELLLIAGFFATLAFGTDATSRAAGTLAGGGFGLVFWAVVVGSGLIVPLLIETAETRRLDVPAALSKAAPILKLLGSAALRLTIVAAGLQTVL